VQDGAKASIAVHLARTNGAPLFRAERGRRLARRSEHCALIVIAIAGGKIAAGHSGAERGRTDFEIERCSSTESAKSKSQEFI
jgi:hypothetical protein